MAVRGSCVLVTLDLSCGLMSVVKNASPSKIKKLGLPRNIVNIMGEAWRVRRITPVAIELKVLIQAGRFRPR